MRYFLPVFVSFVLLVFMSSLKAQVDFMHPYEADEHTVLLLHFDGDLSDASGQTAGGTGYGDFSFVPGLDNLGQCLYLNNSSVSDSSRVLVPDTAALDIKGSFTVEAWVYFLTFGEGWNDWRGAPRILAKPYAVNSSFPNTWWFPNYWLMGDSYNDMPLLETCGLKFAPANARDEVKALADVVLPSNDADAVAEAVDYLLQAKVTGE